MLRLYPQTQQGLGQDVMYGTVIGGVPPAGCTYAYKPDGTPDLSLVCPAGKQALIVNKAYRCCVAVGAGGGGGGGGGGSGLSTGLVVAAAAGVGLVAFLLLRRKK